MIAQRSAASLIFISTALLTLGTANAAQAQARRWVVPDNVIDFTANGPVITKFPTPPISPFLAHHTAANSAFDSNGNLLFYVMNTPSFDFPRQPSTMGIFDARNELVTSIESDDSIDQIAVFAVPDHCDQFFIVYFHYTDGPPGTSNVALLYSVYDASQKQLIQNNIQILQCQVSRPHAAFAVSHLRQGKTRFLYSIACGDAQKFVAQPSGSIVLGSTLFKVATPVTGVGPATQAVLSSDDRQLAWSNGDDIFVVGLDTSTGDNLTPQPAAYNFAATGLAFSPNGSLLLFSPSAQTGGPLSYFDPATLNSSSIPNSNGYAGSLLQLAADHKIYAAGASDLGTIDLTTNPPSFIPAAIPNTIAGLPKPKTGVVTRTLPYQINGESQLTCENLCGNPALIQSNFGQQGNFEVVVPYPGGGLAHYWRDNDGTQQWYGPTLFGAQAGAVDAVSLIQSNFGQNLEVVARIDDQLVHFWRDSNFPTQTWYGPFPIASGVSGTPAFIQGQFGFPGDFEVVTPLASGGMAHFSRNNSPSGNLPWLQRASFATSSIVSDVSLIQGDLGTTSDNLEVVARIGDQLTHSWRDSPSQTWYGPFPFASGVSGTPSFVQGNFGVPGHFELVTPLQAGGMEHLWRENSTYSWFGPSPFSGDAVRSVSVIQGNYGNNLEVVARIGCSLVHYWRESFQPFDWHLGGIIP